MAEIHYHILRASLNRFGKSPTELDEEQISEIRNQAIREFRIEQLILNSEEGRDVHVPDSVVDEAMQRIVTRYPDRESFLQDLDDNRMDETGFRDAIARELHATAVLDKVGSRSSRINDVDCMIYFYMHPGKFQQPETREICHILVTVNEEFPENSQAVAHARITDILKRVKNRPKRFTEQAIKHSECPTALNGGYLGKLPRGQLYPELEEVAFRLKAGEVSDIIQSPLGFHILYCQAAHAAGPVSFREAEPKIREHLTRRRARMCQKVWLSDLKEQYATQEVENGKS